MLVCFYWAIGPYDNDDNDNNSNNDINMFELS